MTKFVLLFTFLSFANICSSQSSCLDYKCFILSLHKSNKSLKFINSLPTDSGTWVSYRTYARDLDDVIFHSYLASPTENPTTAIYVIHALSSKLIQASLQGTLSKYNCVLSKQYKEKLTGNKITSYVSQNSKGIRVNYKIIDYYYSGDYKEDGYTRYANNKKFKKYIIEIVFKA